MPQPSSVSCEIFEEHASAMLDDDVDGALLVALQAHGASCDSCSAFLTELATIQRDAAALPVLTPSRDLWSGIAERIATPVVQLPALPLATAPAATEPRGGAPAWFRRPWLAAAAAVLLVASSAAVTYRLLAPTASANAASGAIAAPAIAAAPGRPTGEPGAVADAVVPGATDPGLAPTPTTTTPSGTTPRARLAANRPARPGPPDVNGAYAPEIDYMRTLLDQRRAGLDTATVRVLETNLEIIDRAIRESRAALARDPASGLLNRQLSDALGQKLELMRTAVQLSSGA